MKLSIRCAICGGIIVAGLPHTHVGTKEPDLLSYIPVVQESPVSTHPDDAGEQSYPQPPRELVLTQVSGISASYSVRGYQAPNESWEVLSSGEVLRSVPRRSGWGQDRAESV